MKQLLVHFRSDPVTAYIRAPNPMETDVLHRFHEHSVSCPSCFRCLDNYNSDSLCLRGQRRSHEVTSRLAWKVGRFVIAGEHNPIYDIVVEIPRRFYLARVLIWSIAHPRIYRPIHANILPVPTRRTSLHHSSTQARQGLSIHQYEFETYRNRDYLQRDASQRDRSHLVLSRGYDSRRGYSHEDYSHPMQRSRYTYTLQERRSSRYTAPYYD